VKSKRSLVAALAVAALGNGPVNTYAEFIGHLDVETEYDDNIYLLESDEEESWIGIVRPGAEFIFEQGANTYTLYADVESGTYTNSVEGDDDYLDYRISGDADFQFNIRNYLSLFAEHKHGHDARGTGRTDVVNKFGLGFPDEPDEWDHNTVKALYEFGAPSARGRLALQANYLDVNYTNNRNRDGVFAGTKNLDREDTELRATGYLKVWPKTSLLLEVRGKDVSYDQSIPNRDSFETRVFTGLEWEATAKTTGAVRLGYQEKDPDAQSADKTDSVAWEADIVWQPKSYSSFEFNTYSGTDESVNSLSYIEVDLYELTWSHDWSDRVNTQLFYRYKNDDYEGPTVASSVREDSTDTFGMGVGYNAFEWLELKASYYNEDRSSSIDGLDYRRNVVSLGAEVELR